MPSTTPIDDPASASLRRQAEAVLSAGQQRAAEVEAKVRAGEAPDNATCYRGPGGAAVAVTASEGVTAKFGTGARRSDTVEEFRYDLITPIGLREVARTCAEGAAKYDDYNWEKGMPVNDLLNHALAHVYQFLAGDRSEPHLPHAAWNMLAAIHSDTLWPHLNDGTLRGPGCSPPRRDAQADPAMPSAAESRYAASGKAVEVVRAGEHDATTTARPGRDPRARPAVVRPIHSDLPHARGRRAGVGRSLRSAAPRLR